jgi:Ca2+-binding EF-hand superfamily protein
MQTSRYLSAGLLTLGLAGTATTFATAQAAPAVPEPPAVQASADRADFRGGRGDHEHRGGSRGHGGGEMFRTLFEAVDADGDGSVTQVEVDAYRTARVTEADASGDGALSIEEFDTLYRAFTRSRMVDAFQELDSDGDGVISTEEMDTSVTRLVERLDRNGDGSVTLPGPGDDDR